MERIFFTYDAPYARDANADKNVYLMEYNSGVELTRYPNVMLTSSMMPLYQSPLGGFAPR